MHVTEHTKKLLPTLILATFAALWMSYPYQGFMAFLLIPAVAFLSVTRISQAMKYPDTRRLQVSRVAIWLTSVVVVFTIHHIRAEQWRETADRVANEINEYAAREGHCPESIDRWITPGDAKTIHLIYACYDGKPGLIYMDSFEAIARYYYRFDQRAWEWNSG